MRAAGRFDVDQMCHGRSPETLPGCSDGCHSPGIARGTWRDIGIHHQHERTHARNGALDPNGEAATVITQKYANDSLATVASRIMHTHLHERRYICMGCSLDHAARRL